MNIATVSTIEMTFLIQYSTFISNTILKVMTLRMKVIENDDHSNPTPHGNRTYTKTSADVKRTPIELAM